MSGNLSCGESIRFSARLNADWLTTKPAIVIYGSSEKKPSARLRDEQALLRRLLQTPAPRPLQAAGRLAALHSLPLPGVVSRSPGLVRSDDEGDLAMTRDLSQKQLNERLARFGITKPRYSFGGYYEVTTNRGTINVSAWNAGTRLRDQLAYLLNEQAKWNAREPAAIAKAEGGSP